MQHSNAVVGEGVTIEIGGTPIRLRTSSPPLRRMLEERYAGFVKATSQPRLQFDIDLHAPAESLHPDDDLQVRQQAGEWLLQRGDFRAQWDAAAGQGRIWQSASPYAIDTVLRIVHSMVLARQGGFLLHAASAIRNGRAFLFAGISGAGKTTISRLAPADATVLTDEISYIRREGDGYRACGTPFAGELARIGENQSAPLAKLFFLAKGRENSIEPVTTAEALRLLMRNILFFADDAELVNLVFQTACQFVEHVPVQRLTFVPDRRVWNMIY